MPFAVAAAAIGAGATIYAGSQAASAQKSAANSANRTQLQMFDTVQKDLSPYMSAGGNALTQLDALLGIGTNTGQADFGSLNKPFSMADFQHSPGYEFAKNQGIDAIQNSAAASGGVVSGNTLKALQQFGTGLANQDWYNAMNADMAQKQRVFGNLYNLSSLGENAAAGVGNAAIQTGQGVANNIIGAGNVSAANAVNTGTAISNAFNTPGVVNALQGLFSSNSNTMPISEAESFNPLG